MLLELGFQLLRDSQMFLAFSRRFEATLPFGSKIRPRDGLPLTLRLLATETGESEIGKVSLREGGTKSRCGMECHL